MENCKNVLKLFSDNNSTVSNCDVLGTKLPVVAELPAATELQRNGVNTALMKEEDSHSVGKLNVETLAAVQDEIASASVQQQSTVPRVHGSSGYSQTAAEPAVPLSDNQQFGFRYNS